MFEMCTRTLGCLCFVVTLTVVGGGGRGARPYSYQYFKQEFLPPDVPQEVAPPDYSAEIEDDAGTVIVTYVE